MEEDAPPAPPSAPPAAAPPAADASENRVEEGAQGHGDAGSAPTVAEAAADGGGKGAGGEQVAGANGAGSAPTPKEDEGVEEEKGAEKGDGNGDSEEEDVDLDGLDLEDENGADDAEEDDMDAEEEEEEEAPGAGEGGGEGGVAAAVPVAAEAESHEYDEVIAEHKNKLQELREKATEDLKAETDPRSNLQKRLQYLMAQSEVFTHFLDSSGSMEGSKAGKGGGRTRMKEKDEDAILMKQAQSKARVTRVLCQPSIIEFGTMRSYQVEGLNWMIKLHDNGINGILADEMGLGKTLQCISLLAYLRVDRGIHGPHIVIVPKSTVGNWIREFKRWCPTIHVVKLLGGKDERKKVVQERILPGKFEVLVTSYECVLREKSALSKHKWRYLVIDEAHRIKNENSSLSKVVRTFNTGFRLLITGTPLQNNLHELWALLNFLLPDVFASSEAFDSWFNISSDEDARENVIKKLHTVLRPFMLRRVKSDVEKDLPPKKEMKLYIGMTAMQRMWYKKILSKDASTLNALGGPDRVRLLNILMQLRKVCNHPYLFDGAEPGPPFENGPHIHENTGKMVLLHKLLPKLNEQGSRVLIFSQMTRLLDILEDYMHMTGYDYCRIDGSTSGELRDSQMAEFNEPGSPKFAFLLSTRAGGLGINLQTADTVILYDSDWNPQADLQAMDRAHRIGQTKPVRVFRFITDKSVEVKMVERADRKLFLDAAVIQQGRLAEKHTQLSKDELMAMVKFGADEVLRYDDNTDFTDEDIDTLLERGEKRTAEAKALIENDARHNLANFSLMGEDTSGSSGMHVFEGENYKTGKGGGHGGNLINLPQRERKKNYDVNEYYRSALRVGEKALPQTRRKKGLSMYDYQFYNRERLEAIQAKEHNNAEQRIALLATVKELRVKSRQKSYADIEGGTEGAEAEATRLEAEANSLELTSREQAEKERLIAEAFGDMSRKDFRAFISAMERNGREDVDAIVKEWGVETGKDEAWMRRYFKVFWKRYKELSDWSKLIDKIEKGERRILRSREIREALEKKVMRHKSPWQNLTINYGGSKGKVFTEEEDAFLVNMMHRFGYGNWEVIRMEIRKAWQFRFDWFFKSRNTSELQRRGDTLIRQIEKENEEVEASALSKGGGARKRKSNAADSGKRKAATPASNKKRRR